MSPFYNRAREEAAIQPYQQNEAKRASLRAAFSLYLLFQPPCPGRGRG
jgi:hypothetical protein